VYTGIVRIWRLVCVVEVSKDCVEHSDAGGRLRVLRLQVTSKPNWCGTRMQTLFTYLRRFEYCTHSYAFLPRLWAYRTALRRTRIVRHTELVTSPPSPPTPSLVRHAVSFSPQGCLSCYVTFWEGGAEVCLSMFCFARISVLPLLLSFRSVRTVAVGCGLRLCRNCRGALLRRLSQSFAWSSGLRVHASFALYGLVVPAPMLDLDVVVSLTVSAIPPLLAGLVFLAG